jgi:hypothetical protein
MTDDISAYYLKALGKSLPKKSKKVRISYAKLPSFFQAAFLGKLQKMKSRAFLRITSKLNQNDR